MEIEAKFSVPDRETFQRLQAAEELAGFALSPGQEEMVDDTYLDTADRQLLAAGYACRRRKQGERLLLTLKELRTATGVIHRREELEVQLPFKRAAPSAEGEDPEAWPVAPARDRVISFVGGARLLPLFDMRQLRTARLMSVDDRTVAELSLDQVQLTAERGELTYCELEVELLPHGAEDDLSIIAACLGEQWGLEPEPRSKFERAVAFLEEKAPLEESAPQGILLTPDEREVCGRMATRDDLHGRRARALLALDEGATQEQAGLRADMSPRRVRHWLAEFRRRHLGVFRQRILDDALTPAAAAIAAAASAPESEPEPRPEPVEEHPPAKEEPAPEPWALETLFNTYDVDPKHAISVASRALVLFDHLLPHHGLSAEARALLEVASLAHDVGMQIDLDQHHIVGRDILLVHPPAELDDLQRQMVAATTFLHRKRMSRKKLDDLAQTSFGDLPEAVQAEVLAIAALLRMADGLDFSQTGTSRLRDVQMEDGEVEFTISGPHAEVEANRARKKSDLWHLLFDAVVRFRGPAPLQVGTTPQVGTAPAIAEAPAQTAEPEAATALEVQAQPTQPAVLSLPDQPGLDPDDGMAEAARKTLYFHFQRMLFHEPGTRLGEDIEELHQMRVATRRMRAACRVFGEYLDMDQMASRVKGLRRTARVLGAVRDLDVFWDKTQRYLDGLPNDQQGSLEPLLIAWEKQREHHRRRMLTYLSSARFTRFTEDFDAFLRRPGAGALPILSKAEEPRPYRLRHVLPSTVFERLAAVRAYDEWVTGPDVPLTRLHQLRIAAKYLRYTLEFFQEVLGPEAKPAIKEIKQLQDHLGDLQDAVVASNLLREFLTWGTWGRAQEGSRPPRLPTESIVAPGVAAYLAARQIELQRLLDTFPQAWQGVQDAQFSQLVAASLAAL